MSFQTRNHKPMKRLILEYLQKHGDLSGLEASGMWACRDLPKRISELKQDGHVIRTEMKTDVMGQRYARYYYVGIDKRHAALPRN